MEQPELIKRFNNIVFTPRELDILACMAVGMTISKEIAQALGTSPKTIETHIAHVLTKIQGKKRHDIVSFIRKEGLQQELSDIYYHQILSKEISSQPIVSQDSFLLDFLRILKKNLKKPRAKLVGVLVLLGFTLGVGYRFFLGKLPWTQKPIFLYKLAEFCPTIFIYEKNPFMLFSLKTLKKGAKNAQK